MKNLVVSSIPMDQKRHHSDRNIKGLKKATAAICLLEREDGSFIYGIGVLYPDIKHLYFSRSETRDPEKLYREMYAASRMYYFTDDALRTVTMIADEVVSLKDPCFDNIEKHIPYGYTPERLRDEIFAQKIPKDEIKKIVAEFKRWQVPIDDPFAEVVEKEGFAGKIFSQMHRTGMQSLSLAI